MHAHTCARMHTCVPLLLAWSLQLEKEYSLTQKLEGAGRLLSAAGAESTKRQSSVAITQPPLGQGISDALLCLGSLVCCMGRQQSWFIIATQGGPAVRTGMAHRPVSVFPALSKKRPVMNQLPRLSHKRSSKGGVEDSQVQILLLSSTLLTQFEALDKLLFLK